MDKRHNDIVKKPFLTSEAKRIVDSIFNRLTIEEKIVQLYGIRPNELTDESGKRLSLEKCRKLIPHGIGHICQFACGLDLNPDELRNFVAELQNYLINESTSHLPAIFHEEAITGIAAKGATVYPQQIGAACSWNPILVEKKTRETADSMRELGSTMALSPMADVIRTAHFPRIEESYGEDSYLCSSIGVAFVKGLQKNGIRKGVAACSKHFLGYGGGSECGDKEIMEEILMPHETMIRCAGSKCVMTGYHQYRGEYAVSNKKLIDGILRKYIGFDGIVVSDYGSVSRQWDGKEQRVLKKRAVEALSAGNDMEFSDGISYPFLLEAIQEGTITENQFDIAVKRSLLLKERLGLFDKHVNLFEKAPLNLDLPEYRRTAYELACQSIVMLKNNGILPLKKNISKIALVGPNANTFWCMLGDYTYQSMYAFWWGGKIDSNAPKIITLKDALEEKLSSEITIRYERGCDWSSADESTIIRSGDSDPRAKQLKMMLMNSADKTDWNEAVRIASESDIILAAVGENPTLCGESRERKGIRLPGDQEMFIKQLLETKKPLVLIMFGGRPQVITDISERCAAILQCWYPGEEGGNAVTDILIGNINPSAKLCVSYPKTESRESICYNYAKNMDNLVLYPFGFGLSYSDFVYNNLQMPSKANIEEDKVEITFQIKNQGKYDGTEIVQLYISPQDGQPLKPIQLKGFRRIKLKVGETKKIKVSLPLEIFAFFGVNDQLWHVSPGKYIIKIGTSSSNILLKGEISLYGSINPFPIRKLYFSQMSISK